MTRPAWWPAWIPATCGDGHELAPGKISLSFEQCPDCPASTDGRGHHLVLCRINGCHQEVTPPGCRRGQSRSDGGTGSAGFGSIPARSS